ncbi:MAG: nitroreductase family protein [Muribaculaceae bacterium]|nr:nitroreductase family protein [Muribaculaceae bacterium]
MSYFDSRATVRAYSPREIPADLLRSMIEKAVHAPNTGNMQWYSIIITTSAEGKAALSPAHFNQPSVTSAAAVLTFCLDLNRFEQWCRMNAAEPGFENFQSFVAALIDTSLVAQQFCTVAELNGLGTCYLGTTTYNAPQISEILALPERVIPVTTVTVGYPAAEPSGPTWRLPVEAVTHYERYHPASDADVARWYAPIEADSQRFVEENAKQSLAQVFTDVRYPRESAEYFSKVYSDFLAKNRFL